MIYLEILFWEIPGSAYTKAMCRRLNIPSDKINSYEIILIFFYIYNVYSLSWSIAGVRDWSRKTEL